MIVYRESSLVRVETAVMNERLVRAGMRLYDEARTNVKVGNVI